MKKRARSWCWPSSFSEKHDAPKRSCACFHCSCWNLQLNHAPVKFGTTFPLSSLLENFRRLVTSERFEFSSHQPTQTMGRDFYKLLGVARDATTEQITKALRFPWLSSPASLFHSYVCMNRTIFQRIFFLFATLHVFGLLLLLPPHLPSTLFLFSSPSLLPSYIVFALRLFHHILCSCVQQ